MRGKKTAWALIALLACGTPCRAGLIGDIQGVYYATNPYGISATLDAPSFVFENTSGAAITDGVFTILAGNGVSVADSFNVGTIAAGGNFILETGITSDGGSNHTFFALVGGGLDTSDVGPSGNNVEFQFTGLQDFVPVSTGIFTPGMSLAESNDHTVSSISFLGGPGNADGPCNNCYGPHVIATINSIVPEPSSWLLAGVGLAGAGLYCLRRGPGARGPSPA